MFGLVCADARQLTAKEKQIYKQYYCGVCRCLNTLFGIRGQLSLSYEAAFIALFLNSYFKKEENTEVFRCKPHLGKKKTGIVNEITCYAAKMNLLLFYYKLEDDINDDNNPAAKLYRNALKDICENLAKEYPQKANVITTQLDKLKFYEQNDMHLPDDCASCFGKIVGEIFDFHAEDALLREFGESLGKVVYMFDAAIDLKKDIKHSAFNPLVETFSRDFQQILTIMLEKCTDIYAKMGITENKSIIDNILYSGIWLAYNSRRKNESV